MRYAFFFFTLILFAAQPVLAANPSPQDTPPQLTIESASTILNGIQGEVVSVTPSEVPGLYRVGMRMQGKIYPLYLDASGRYLFSGNIIRVADRANLTEEEFRQLNPIDLSQIPLDDALLLGNPAAKHPILVFTDPHCPYCSQLHQVLLEAVKEHPELAFKLKLVPFKQSSKEITKTIICNKSIDQLEMAFAGKSLPKPDCDTDAGDKNLALAQQLGIRGTPSLIMPNGLIFPGYRSLDDLMTLIKENTPTDK